MFRIVFCWISWTARSSFEWKHFSCIELNWAEMYTKSNLTWLVCIILSGTFLPSSLHRICMRKFDFIDFLLWNPDEQDFYSYQKFNINLDWIQNHYEVEIVFETNFNEILYQLLVEKKRINKIKDKIRHWISQMRLYNEFCL